MRRELAAIGLAIALLAVGYPGASQVIDPPDLSWIQNGFTLTYHAENATETLDFNVTVENKTASKALLVHWIVDDNGVNDTFHSSNISLGNRSNLDLLGLYTFLWVNSTDLESEDAKIGAHKYECIVCLPGTDRVFYNTTTDATYTYDAINGYLVKAEYPDGTTVELTNTEDIGEGAPADGVGPLFVCTREKYKRDIVQVPGQYGETVTTFAWTELCWDERASETNACYGEAWAQVRVNGPFFLLPNSDYWINVLRAHNVEHVAPTEYFGGLLGVAVEDSFSEDLDVWIDADAELENRGSSYTDVAHAFVEHKCGSTA